MLDYLKVNWAKLLVIAVFIVTCMLAIVALGQHLRPINAIIDAYQRLIDVAQTETAKFSLQQSLAPYIRTRGMVIMLYLAVIMFLAYMATIRIVALCGKKMPTIILPVVSGVNVILLLAVAFSMGDFAAGLGLFPLTEIDAGAFAWHEIPEVMAGSSVLYIAPTFWTIVFPLVFCGILPLITGLKEYIKEKRA